MRVKKYIQCIKKKHTNTKYLRRWYYRQFNLQEMIGNDGKFENGNFHLKDVSYTGCLVTTDSDQINTLIDNCHLITWDIN